MNWPGGSFPITSRTSWPSSRSAAACSSACSTTAPQKDHENGTTIPTFISARVYARPAQCADAARRRAPRDPDHRRRATERRLLHPRARPAAVKKTVNQDDPTVYHLFYADEKGSAVGHHLLRVSGRHPRQGRGRDGAHDRLAGSASRRRSTSGSSGCKARRGASRAGESLTFEDPEGVRHELRVVETEDEPLVAKHPEIPEEHALQGFDGVRAYAVDPERSSALLEDTLGFAARGDYTGSASGAAAGTVPTTHRPRARHPAPEPCTTSRGRRRSTITTLAGAGRRGRAPADARDRPLLLQVDLLPRAERHPVRARHARARLRDRRGSRAPRRAARSRPTSSTCASRSSRD